MNHIPYLFVGMATAAIVSSAFAADTTITTTEQLRRYLTQEMKLDYVINKQGNIKCQLSNGITMHIRCVGKDGHVRADEQNTIRYISVYSFAKYGKTDEYDRYIVAANRYNEKKSVVTAYIGKLDDGCFLQLYRKDFVNEHYRKEQFKDTFEYVLGSSLRVKEGLDFKP